VICFFVQRHYSRLYGVMRTVAVAAGALSEGIFKGVLWWLGSFEGKNFHVDSRFT